MTLDDYFEFLEQYWKMFGPPPPRPIPPEFTNVKI